MNGGLFLEQLIESLRETFVAFGEFLLELAAHLIPFVSQSLFLVDVDLVQVRGDLRETSESFMRCYVRRTLPSRVVRSSRTRKSSFLRIGR